MTEKELIYTIALTRLPRLNLQNQRLLIEQAGSASAIFENRFHIKDIVPKALPVLTEVLGKMEEIIPRAEEELDFVQKNHIRCLCINDVDYPARLRECSDAPILLFYLGNTNLNAAQILSVVGTRQITEHGKDLCANLLKDLKSLCPNTLVVSGLAYGVDIHAHRAALQNHIDTVGVLAHGLDQIYPRLHSDTAAQMVQQGGLLTEFMSRTNADKRNFVQRNRIVAGMADAVVVVESAGKGGSLITAEIAGSYNREVLAFPGRPTDKYSAGCNELIRNNKAQLITCARDLVESLNWIQENQRNEKLRNGIQQELFPELNVEERRVIKVLEQGTPKHINLIAIDTGIPIGQISGLLFSMEMKGLVKMSSGGQYHLL